MKKIHPLKHMLKVQLEGEEENQDTDESKSMDSNFPRGRVLQAGWKGRQSVLVLAFGGRIHKGLWCKCGFFTGGQRKEVTKKRA